MQADWEAEIDGDAPVIEAKRPGFVNLQLAPERAWRLPETAEFPPLAKARAWLNSSSSPVWTSKCDLWPHLEPEAFDPLELDALNAAHDGAAHAMRCCRIELVLRRAFPTPERMGLGVTACLTACGRSATGAARVLQEALAAFTGALCPDATLQ